jgi:hypothetical protein
MAIDGQRGQALLKPETFHRMLYTPVPSSAADKGPTTEKSSGLCWTVVSRKDGVDFWHTGGLIGSNGSWLVRTSKGVTLAFTFNSLPTDYTGFFQDVLPTLLDKITAVGSWPKVDLLDRN